MKKFIALFASLFISTTANAQTQPPIETYGKLPIMRSIDISPSGTHYAYLKTQGDDEYFLILNRADGSMKGINTSAIKARSAYFVSDKHAILSASETTGIRGFRGDIEYTAAFSYNLETGDITQLLRREKSLFPAQSGIGRIEGISTDGKSVFMPAYSGDRYTKSPPLSLYRAKLNSKHGRIISKGKHSTIDWVVNGEGVVLAREDYNHNSDFYEIVTERNGKWESVYEEKNALLPPFSLIGTNADESALVVSLEYSDGGGDTLFELSYDGKLSEEEIFHRPGKQIASTIMGKNRKLLGVRYAGMTTSYAFFDKDLENSVQNFIDKYPSMNFSLESWNKDWSLLIFSVAGGNEAGAFYLFEPETGDVQRIAVSRDIAPEAVGKVETTEYTARDGLKIPALITWPPGKTGEKNLPAIIMPHGGPEAYDTVSFDWMAQYFANRGYVILQPNFRGSSGFGSEFAKMGHKQWGGKMQDDITDGVKYLSEQGIIDPQRVCIAGASYGGYASLAGGAFTPELYKCIVAVSPVTDLRGFIDWNKKYRGRRSRSVDYWKRAIGDPSDDKDMLKDRSPVNHADAFQAPVLIIHGKDDTIVPIHQSRKMNSALKKADKSVEFIDIKGEDHWMSKSETRLATLKAMADFIEQHNPAD